jgi:hypothetical protein
MVPAAISAQRYRAMTNPFDLKTVLLAKHAQHVVLIHFPIALFISAVAFDLVAQWTKRPGLADSAYYNLLVAAISTLPVLATGILAWQFQLEGQKLIFGSRYCGAHRALGRIPQRCKRTWLDSDALIFLAFTLLQPIRNRRVLFLCIGIVDRNVTRS